MSGADATLDLPSRRAFPSYIAALREGFRRGIETARTKDEIDALEENPAETLAQLNAPATGTIQTPSGHSFPRVPYETLWLCAGDHFIGGVSFRHELNELLLHMGGHVGYGIRPSMEGKGYGTLALRLTASRAAARGMDRLLLTCAPDNIASERIIVKNGGIYENTTDNSRYGFGLTKRFWVPTQRIS